MGRTCSRYGERRGAYRLLVERSEKGEVMEGHHLKDQGLDGSIILKWIFEK
jgi:hypothetical protein